MRIEASWPESAAVLDTWEMTAGISEVGSLVYHNGQKTVTEYDEDGYGWVVDDGWDESGTFYLNEEGLLCWHDDMIESDEDSVFIRAD